MDYTETRIATEVRAVLARHHVAEDTLLESIRALAPDEAARLARELRACADEGIRTSRAKRQVEIRPWSFLRRTATDVRESMV